MFAPLDLKPYHLTSISELGEFAVSTWAVLTAWIVDQATTEPLQVVLIEGEGQ